MILAEGYERLAKHAAYLADHDAHAAYGRPGINARFLERVYRCLSISVRGRRLRTAGGRPRTVACAVPRRMLLQQAASAARETADMFPQWPSP